MEIDRSAAALRGQTIQMLHEVLAGEPCAAVSARWGVSRSAVERRVKSLAIELTLAVGIDGLRVEGANFMGRIRLRREAVLQALHRFEPVEKEAQRSARALTREEVALGALRVRSRSTRPSHDLALFFLLFATGLRPLEVVRLEVADYLQVDGAVRRESEVRRDVAINRKERPLFFGHRRLDEALQAYLGERARDGHAVGEAPHFWRGLDPHSPLFLDVDGFRYSTRPERSTCEQRDACRGLLEVYRRIFRHADISGLCSQSARLTLMSRMYERGADEDQVGRVLGIADRSAVRGQMPRPRLRLSALLDESS